MLFVFLILNLAFAWDADTFKQSMQDIQNKIQETNAKIEQQMNHLKQKTKVGLSSDEQAKIHEQTSLIAELESIAKSYPTDENGMVDSNTYAAIVLKLANRVKENKHNFHAVNRYRAELYGPQDPKKATDDLAHGRFADILRTQIDRHGNL